MVSVSLTKAFASKGILRALRQVRGKERKMDKSRSREETFSKSYLYWVCGSSMVEVKSLRSF